MISMRSGFTLVEMMVVISIIGLFASIVIASLNNVREAAKVSVAQAELRSIAEGSLRLQLDTNLAPGGFPSAQCSDATNAADMGNGIDVNDPNTGLLSGNPTKYPNWNGPYIQTINDPWDRPYVIDSWYHCVTGEVAEEAGHCMANGDWYRVIYSRGPNGSWYNGYDSDNVAYVVCKH
jgi:general secretion pathway protein G